MNLTSFYNLFHKQSKVQTKIIDRGNFTYSQLIKVLEEHLKKMPRKLKILDFGCGVGTLSFYLASFGHSVLGIDISKRAVAMCRKSSEVMQLKNRTRFLKKKNLSNFSSKQYYDLIICIEVIEHIADDVALVKNFYKLLKRGGNIVLSTPSINAPLYKLGLTRNFDKKVGHLRRYDPNKLSLLLNDLGFEIKRVIKTEGFIRNSLYVIPVLGIFVRFIKGPLVGIVTFIDNLTLPLFGESDIFIIATKK